jgi:hypothetical protein
MNPLVNANQPQQPTGGNPFETKDIGSSNARLAEMQRALTGGRKRKTTKGGAAPGALPNGGTGTVVATFPNASGGENGVLVELAVVQQQALANRTFTGGKQSGGRRNKGRKSRKSHKKRRIYQKKTRRRYKY